MTDEEDEETQRCARCGRTTRSPEGASPDEGEAPPSSRSKAESKGGEAGDGGGNASKPKPKLLMLHRCSRCKVVRYCSRDCQRKDWREHKRSCRAAAAGTCSTTDNEAKKRADETWASGVAEYFAARSMPRGNFRSAMDKFEWSLSLYPSNARRWHFLGVCYLSHTNSPPEKARKCLEKAFDLDPNDRVIALELNFFYAQRGDVESARRHAREVAKRTEGLWSNEWQRPGVCIQNIAAKAFWERGEFPWSEKLEEFYPAIRKELLALWGVGEGRRLDQMPRRWGEVGSVHAGHDSELVASGGSSSPGSSRPEWREYVLFGGDNDPRMTADARLRAPRTMAVLEKLVPEATDMAGRGLGEVVFSVLAPGTRLKPHCASTNARLTCHLGLVVPKNGGNAGACRIRVGEEWRTWDEGKCLFFDDSFEHEVEQYADSPRAVLLLRFWHPGIPKRRWEAEMREGMVQFNELQGRRQIPPMEGEQRRNFAKHMRDNEQARRMMGLGGLLRDGSMEMP